MPDEHKVHINIPTDINTKTNIKLLARKCGMPFQLFMNLLYQSTLTDNPKWIKTKLKDMEKLAKK